MMSRLPKRSRRTFLRLIAGGAGALLLPAGRSVLAVAPSADNAAAADPIAPAPTPDASVSPASRATAIASQSERRLLSGTPSETTLVIARAETPGPTVLVLGGVHGNEPGAWVAAGEVAGWRPRAGTLLVIPRANVLAIEACARTLPALGDLNRLYPGYTTTLPMSRMAAAIVDLAAEFGVDVLYDMHESWGFFGERPVNSNAFLGQTVSSGAGPESATIAKALVARVNPRIGARRDRMIARAEVPPPNVRTTNSLGIGRFVAGVTGVLVEMGQQGQAEDRRVELHLLVARAFLESRGML